MSESKATSSSEEQALVFDTSASWLRVGWGGEDAPSLQRPTAFSDADKLARLNNQSDSKLDWDSVEKLWTSCLEDLKTSAEGKTLVLSEQPLNRKAHRERCAQLAFEALKVGRFYLESRAVLSLYASGRTTGVAVHCGDTRSYVVPVQECKSLEPSVLFAPRGGRDVDAALAKLLARRTNAEAAAAAAAVIRDPALLRALKEKYCYLAPNFERECESMGGQHPDWFDRQFQLPDGRQLTVAARERFECCEALVAGGGADSLGQLVYAAIFKNSVDIRKLLYGNIVLTGGGTLFKGMNERLQRDVSALAPVTMRVHVVAMPERRHSAWIGGSIVASVPEHYPGWITRKEYEEAGASIVHRRGTK